MEHETLSQMLKQLLSAILAPAKAWGVFPSFVIIMTIILLIGVRTVSSFGEAILWTAFVAFAISTVLYARAKKID